MQKRILCGLFACVLLLGGCSTNTNVHKKEPEKQKDTENNSEVNKTYEFTGVIKDLTSNSIMVKNQDEEKRFDREQMKMEDTDTLLLDEEVSITYRKEKEHLIALQCVVKKVAKQQEEKTEKEVAIDKIIASMSIEEKVGQIFFVRCPDMYSIEDVDTYHLGGYILFDRDFKDQNYQDVVAKLTAYQKEAKVPLLIGVDEEGGTVNRVSTYFREVPFWSPQDLYQEGGMPLIISDTKEKAELLKGMGINVNLAPVADVSTHTEDFIYARSFGKNAHETANYVKTVVHTMKKNHIGSCLKHFPGYGNNVDTHTGIAIDKRSMATFENSDFIPFSAGIQAGADSVLVSHNIVKCMDAKHPASLSAKVHRILREQLKFQGVIMSDDLAMDAITQYSDDASVAVSAVKAGNDLLICSNYRVQLPAVLEAVKKKEIQEEQIDASLRRILKWKYDLGLLS